ncbi:DUF5994 family protein [Mycolicibacterium sp.]|uniref:DUF5994 family protein n=1 Tax=Mycolicibacterium sp. TaxID=2320850 RepID=UPI0025E524CD|nr:DUF5994 family protein [Mycolicibacterium sp.]
MTRHHDQSDDKRNASPPERTPRLRLKAKAPQTGYVDGAWWPHSDSLPTELPDLLAVLSVRLGPIDRVLYNVGEWSASPARLVIGDRSVRLDGYRNQPPHSIEILGLDRSRITLLVVPPSTSDHDAHTAMMTAAAVNNDSTVDGLLLSRTS